MGLDLQNPAKTDPENWTESCVITGKPVTALRGKEEFSTADHSAYLQEGRVEVQKRSVLQTEEALAETLASARVQCTRRLRRSTKIGAWLTSQPSTVNGTGLGAQEWRDALFLRYVI